jgi:hypothetical protein
MRYSNALEIIAMTLLWAAVLIGYDRIFNQHLFQPSMAQVQALSTPQVTLWIQNVGCSGKVEKTLQALRALSWLDMPERQRMPETPGAGTAVHAPGPPTMSCDITVLAKVRDVEAADFMAIYNVLRPLDVVPTMVEFGGIPHFALQAEVANLHCEACDRAMLDALRRSAAHALAPRKDPQLGETFKWLDSKRVDLQAQTITAFVRFNNVAHVDEMVEALTQAGLPPWSIQVVLEEARKELQHR